MAKQNLIVVGLVATLFAIPVHADETQPSPVESQVNLHIGGGIGVPLDPTGKVSIDYGVYGVPETFFIDARGRIRAKHVGSVTDVVFQREVERLLAEPR